MKNNPTQHVEYYPELRAFLEGSNESEITRGHLRKILEKRLQGVPKDYDFSVLDVGCSDGEMILPLVAELREKLPRLKYVALEPETSAFKRLIEGIKRQGLNFIQPVNKPVKEYLKTVKGQEGLFDLVLFSESFYYFPQAEWDDIFSDTLRLLRPNGFAMVIIESLEGQAYKLYDLITSGRADVLEFGYPYYAEHVERFLTDKGIRFETKQFPIYIFVKDNEQKLTRFVRMLAFIYHTFPEKILTNYREPVEKFMEECKGDGQYALENVVKIITFARR
ncbi:MAG: class I SAM-dependent methyltransferase [Candidatus Brocadiaceae bacterium]|nr:class I SAM-dependent methyltransferase [Candidatus Brocadiaceae bacterium]